MATTLVPVEDYLQNLDRYPHTEFVDGLLVPKSMSSLLHGLLQAWFCYLFSQRYPEYAVVTEVHSRLRPSEYRLPDVAVLRPEIAFSETYAHTPFVLVIEILSPDDRPGAQFEKCERYHKWGVPYCWVVDPVKRHAWSYGRDDEEPQRVSDRLQAGEIQFTLEEIFQKLKP